MCDKIPIRLARWLPVHALLLTAVIGLGGCAPVLTSLIVSAPNRLNPFLGTEEPWWPPAESIRGIDEHFRVDVGPPAASLAVSVLHPAGERRQPHGTILLVHGVFSRGFWQHHNAKMFADAGYRAVLVDLRGHGRSTGAWLTYGVREAEDLSQVIDVLEHRGLLAGKLGVYGMSYGATTAIHLAGLDPRVRAVVSVAPFSNMHDEVPHYIKTILPGVGAMIPETTYQQVIDEVGRTAHFDPRQADAAVAIQRTDAPVLIVHGMADWMVPTSHGVRLHEAARDHSQLMLVPNTGHVKIWFDPTGEVAAATLDWFDLWLD